MVDFTLSDKGFWQNGLLLFRAIAKRAKRTAVSRNVSVLLHFCLSRNKRNGKTFCKMAKWRNGELFAKQWGILQHTDYTEVEFHEISSTILCPSYGPLSPLQPCDLCHLYGPLSPLRPSDTDTTHCHFYGPLSPLRPSANRFLRNTFRQNPSLQTNVENLSDGLCTA